MITYEQARQNLIDQVRLIVNALAPAAVKLYTPDERVTLWKAFDQTARKWETKFAKGAASSLEHDRRSILALLTGAKSLAKQRKATVNWKKLLKDIEDYMAGAGSEHWRETFAPLIEGIVTDQGEKWAARLGTQFDVQNLYARDWFNNYTLEFAQPINDTTLTEIGQVMARAQAEGSSIPEIQDQLDAMFEREISGRLPDDPEYDWYTDRTPPYRTEMIARTETIRSSNAGTTEIFTEWGVQKKEWLSTQDDRTRGSKPNDEFDHVEANGQVVGIDEPFIVSGEELQYPGDPAGSPGNTISCRCTVLPVIPDEGLPEQAPEEEEDVLTLEESELLKNYPELGQIADQIYLDSTSPEARRNLSEMTDLPPELMRMLKDNGAEIRIGDEGVIKLDDMGFLSSQSPRGWPEGTTWDKVGGVFAPDKNIIGVGSHNLSGSSSTILHEIGHALDKYAGNVSVRNTDIEAFLIKYADQLSPYYRQPDLRANLQEIFAEAFAQALTKNIVLRPLPEEIVDYVGKLAGKR